MTVTSTFTVEIGSSIVSKRFDVTSRVYGFSTDVNAPIGRFGRAVAQITLDNNDGAFTPGAGGTYSDINWFKQGVFIKAVVQGPSASETVQLFHGILTEFDLTDDGLNSTVTIQCVDALTVGGQSVSTFSAPSSPGTQGGSPSSWIMSAFNGSTAGNAFLSGVEMPILGASRRQVLQVVSEILGNQYFGVAFPPVIIYLSEFSLSQPALDWLNNTILPSGPNVAWPGRISGGSQGPQYYVNALDVHLVRRASERSDVVFAEQATGGELPFRDLDRAFTSDQLINQAVIGNLFNVYVAQETVTTKNEESIKKFGVRSLSASGVMSGRPTGSGAIGEFPSDVTVTRISERYANVRSEVEFAVRSLTVSLSMVDDKVGGSQSSADMFAQLLDQSDSLWQLASVEYTPTGGSSAKTEHAVIVGRRVSATPNDVRVDLTLLPWTYVSGLVLDDSLLATLGGTLDTYDESSFTYDDLVVPYDGTQVATNRLG